MATFVEGNRISRNAGADLSAKQYYVVKTDASGDIVLASAATDAILGVLQNKPASGDTADVALINGNGTGKVLLGGNVSKDAYLTANGNGEAIATTTSGNRVFGRALAAGSDGDIIEYVKYNEIHA